MLYVIAYFAILLPFGLLDAVWLSLMGPRLYRPTLGDILLANVNVAPAIFFYLIYPIGTSGLCRFARAQIRFGYIGADIRRAVRRTGLCHLRSDQSRHAAKLDAAVDIDGYGMGCLRVRRSGRRRLLSQPDGQRVVWRRLKSQIQLFGGPKKKAFVRR